MAVLLMCVEMELHRTVWGPRFWSYIHTTSLTTPDVAATKASLKQIVETVPCSECAPHARSYMQKHAKQYEAITTAAELFAFYVHFHNAVNARLGNEHGEWSVERARAFYSKSPPRFCGRYVAASVLIGAALGFLLGRVSRKCELRCALADGPIED